MANKPEKYDIFISYRRDGGADAAKHLRDILTERGYRVLIMTALQAEISIRRFMDE